MSFKFWAAVATYVAIKCMKCADRKPHLSVFFRISNFEHACPKLNFVLISRLTGKCATQNNNKILVKAYGNVDILYGHIKEPK